MKNDNANSGSTSDETSAAARPIRPPKSPTDEAKAVADVGVGESAYLARQQQLATQAISRALSDALALGKQAADPQKLMATHPWVTLGGSLVAGFAAAAVAVPSKEQQALRKLARIERALNPQPAKPKHESNGNGHAAPDGETSEQSFKAGRSSLTRAILGEVIGALKPAIVSLLTAGVTASAAKTSPEEMAQAAQGNPPASE